MNVKRQLIEALTAAPVKWVPGESAICLVSPDTYKNLVTDQFGTTAILADPVKDLPEMALEGRPIFIQPTIPGALQNDEFALIFEKSNFPHLGHTHTHVR